MIKLLAASATLITLTAISCHEARAYCDEDCAYEAHEAAYERAEERAYAREEAEDEGRRTDEDRTGQRVPPEPRQSPRTARAERAEAKSTPAVRRIGRPQPEPSAPTPPVQSTQPRSAAASENSSIAAASTQIAEEADRPRRQRDVGCKTFFAASGMTLTVPCE